MPSPSQLKKRLTQTTWHHSMPTAARERIKGSADTKGALARNPYPTSNFQIIYANDVTVEKVDDDLAAIEPGTPCVSKWNTLWSRVLRVYIATAQPSNQLQRIANMVMKFFVPMWFQIKRHSYMTDGLHNTFVCL